MPLNYAFGRFVLGSLCVGDLVLLGLSSIRVAGEGTDTTYSSVNSFCVMQTGLAPETSSLPSHFLKFCPRLDLMFAKRVDFHRT